MRKRKEKISNRYRVERARSLVTRGLIEQHLEEMSWLYDQRIYLLEEKQQSWLDVKDNEQRFSKHLVSLQLLDTTSFNDCLTSIDDPGSLHAAVCYFCAKGDFQALSKFLKTIDWANEEMTCAVFRALKRSTPESFRASMQTWIMPKYRNLIDELVVVFGYRRWSLDSFYKIKTKPMKPGVAWAVGRATFSGYYDVLRKAQNEVDPAVKLEVNIALLRCRQRDPIPWLVENMRAQSWARLGLSLCCDGKIQREIVKIVSNDPSIEGVQALGLLGERMAVDCLISQLARPEFADTAAFALHLITGAGLKEEISVPEEVDEDLLDQEDEEDESPEVSDEESSEMIERLSQNPQQWSGWWKANQNNFKHGVRYRFGIPCSPADLLQTIKYSESPVWARRFSYEELVIRYRADMAFETDYLVSEQMEAISRYDHWIRANQKKFTPGKFYLHGKLL